MDNLYKKIKLNLKKYKFNIKMWNSNFVNNVNGKVISTKPLKIDTTFFPKWLIKDIDSIENENGKYYLIVHRDK